MKIIFAALLICSAAVAETAINPIVNGGSKKESSDGPKQPIVSKPPRPPAPPAQKPEPPPPPPTSQELYNEALNRYSNGRDVKWSEIKGSYTGKCMITPIFERRGIEETLLTYLGTSTNSPDTLIENTYDPRVSNNFEKLYYLVNLARAKHNPNPEWMRREAYTPPPKFSNNPTFTEFRFSPNREANNAQTFRLYDKELLSIHTNLKVSSLWIPGTTLYDTLVPGQIWKVCHYTQKVTE